MYGLKRLYLWPICVGGQRDTGGNGQWLAAKQAGRQTRRVGSLRSGFPEEEKQRARYTRSFDIRASTA